MSWQEYRRRRDVVFSMCSDCHRPCPQCCAWARATAFGREYVGDFAEAIAETYRAAERCVGASIMNRRET